MSPEELIESLAAIPEGELVRRLVSDFHWRERILQLHGIPDRVSYFLELDLAGLKAKGDVDILAVEPSIPDQATAIQVKRIRVSANSFGEHSTPNKLSELSKLNRQTSLLVKLGFWQVFAFVFIVVDSRIRNSGDFKFDGLTLELRKKLESAITMDGLADRAGLIAYEFVQPMNYQPLSVGTFQGKIYRMPTCAVQSTKVTRWVSNSISPYRRNRV